MIEGPEPKERIKADRDRLRSFLTLIRDREEAGSFARQMAVAALLTDMTPLAAQASVDATLAA